MLASSRKSAGWPREEPTRRVEGRQDMGKPSAGGGFPWGRFLGGGGGGDR